MTGGVYLKKVGIVKIRSVIYLVIYALMLAVGHILQKAALNLGMDRFVFAFIRISMGFILITVIILAKKHNPVRLLKHNIKPFLILGIGFSGIGILLKLWGLSLTTASNAAFIMSLSSVSAVIFAFFFLKESAPPRFYRIVVAMIAGVYLVTTGGQHLLPRIGDIIILVLAILIGGMQVYGKKILETLSVIQIAFGRSFIGMVFLGIMSITFSPQGFTTIPGIQALLLALVNGITFISSIILFYKALETEQASNAGMFALLVPVVTAVLGYLFLNEILNVYQLIGAVIILGGSYLISRLKISQSGSGTRSITH